MSYDGTRCLRRVGCAQSVPKVIQNIYCSVPQVRRQVGMTLNHCDGLVAQEFLRFIKLSASLDLP